MMWCMRSPWLTTAQLKCATGSEGRVDVGRPAGPRAGTTDIGDYETPARAPGPHGGGPASGGRPNRSGCSDRGGANRSYAYEHGDRTWQTPARAWGFRFARR